jgi:adenylate kinase
MFYNILFIGGIHGVGKSTICKEICQVTGYNYLSASELIKWKQINSDEKNKKVTDIPSTQDRLINGLNEVVLNTKKYLLDGHYCLIDSQSNIVNVPFETFKIINPLGLLVVTDDISEIKKRLESRDNKRYDALLLEKMQEQEINYANEIAIKLDLSLTVIENHRYKDYIKSLP